MSRQYKQRTLDEALELAKSVFKSKAKDFLSSGEIAEMAGFGKITAGSISEDWESVLGYKPNHKKFYEIDLYKPSKEKPFVEKFYARILVSRDFSSEQVEIIWKPEI
jgi:uncharacterized protein YciU (UPF0263 family)